MKLYVLLYMNNSGDFRANTYIWMVGQIYTKFPTKDQLLMDSSCLNKDDEFDVIAAEYHSNNVACVNQVYSENPKDWEKRHFTTRLMVFEEGALNLNDLLITQRHINDEYNKVIIRH